MRVFEEESLEKLYPVLFREILEDGDDVSPRGYLTKEISPATLVITDPKKKVIPSKIRRLNFGFMVAELLWILRGSDNVDEIAWYNGSWRNFSDDGKTLNGAYGKRIFKHPCAFNDGIKDTIVEVNQFKKCYELLKEDPDSRQATIVLFNPLLDNRETKDKPCTNLLRFSIRKNKLNMLVMMRSNDIEKGTPYDIFNFTSLQEIMAGLLGIEVGKYTHVADSLHLYESYFETAKELVTERYPSLYDEVGTFDGRILVDSYEEFEQLLEKINKIEKYTRENKDVNLNKVVNELKDIDNKVWQSYAAILATYNFRKHRRIQNELDELKKFITNEFKSLFEERYNQLH